MEKDRPINVTEIVDHLTDIAQEIRLELDYELSDFEVLQISCLVQKNLILQHQTGWIIP